MVTETKKIQPQLIKIYPETKQRLDSIGKKNDSYDDIIRRLLDESSIVKSQ